MTRGIIRPRIRVYRAQGLVTFDYGDAYYTARRMRADGASHGYWQWQREATRTLSGVNAGDTAYTLRAVEAQTAANRAYILTVQERVNR